MLPSAGEPAAPAEFEVCPEPDGQPDQPFWGFQDVFLVLGLLVAAIVLILFGVAALAVVYPSLRTNPGPLVLPTNLLIYVFLYFIFKAVLGLRYSRPVFAALGWIRSSFPPGFAIAGGVVLAFAVAGLAALLKTPKVQSPIESLMNSPLLLGCFAVMAVTIAPLFEELFFRGFLQPLLTRRLGTVAGILLTAVLFGSLHAPEYSLAWQYAVAVSVVGVVLGWVRLRARSIIPSTIMHGAYNGVFVVALLISKYHPL